MNDLRVAVVTGASSGIGAALVKKLSSIEFKVIMLSRDLNRMELVAEECESKYKPVPIVIDLRNSVSVEQAFKIIKQDFGCIDVLCAVAGVFLNETPISEQLDSDWIDVIETNLTGVMRCLRASWPLFRKGASIVTVGSVLGQMSQPEVGAYAVSKAGLAALTRTIASEGAEREIRANLIIPGMVKTPINQKMANESGNSDNWWRERLSSIPMRRAAEPEEIAEAICWLSTENSNYITGTELRMDGGTLLGPLPNFEKKINL
tara:strand:- start:1349 stop:2134 length:786 start_codon:yes stop_codon:yes gene_type:complete